MCYSDKFNVKNNDELQMALYCRCLKTYRMSFLGYSHILVYEVPFPVSFSNTTPRVLSRDFD